MSNIHPTAIIDSSADLADDVEVGPYSIIGPKVKVDSGCKVEGHAVVKGPSTFGKNNHIFQFATVGEATPDLKYKGEDTTLVVGEGNVFREGVTVHRGTIQDRAETTIGNNNLIMAYAHIGHDCIVGNHTVLVNNMAAAGHVVIDDWAIVGGFGLIHQHCHIGAHSFVGMGSGVKMDVAAFTTVMGAPAETRGINVEGLRRRQFSKTAIASLRRAYTKVFRKNLLLKDAIEQLRQEAEEVAELQVFIDSLERAERGLTR